MKFCFDFRLIYHSCVSVVSVRWGTIEPVSPEFGRRKVGNRGSQWDKIIRTED